jgi:hypothetical protein
MLGRVVRVEKVVNVVKVVEVENGLRLSFTFLFKVSYIAV